MVSLSAWTGWTPRSLRARHTYTTAGIRLSKCTTFSIVSHYFRITKNISFKHASIIMELLSCVSVNAYATTLAALRHITRLIQVRVGLGAHLISATMARSMRISALLQFDLQLLLLLLQRVQLFKSLLLLLIPHLQRPQLLLELRDLVPHLVAAYLCSSAAHMHTLRFLAILTQCRTLLSLAWTRTERVYGRTQLRIAYLVLLL